MSKLSESFVRTAHKHNVKVFTDDKDGNIEEWKKIINWRTDRIQTDQPKELIQLIENTK